MDTRERTDRLCAAIESLGEGRLIVSIDGPCASGKSTLAAAAAERLGANLFHMDDFFLPPDMRTPERLAEPGGNVHYERFLSEVIGGVLSGGEFYYGIFDCSQRRVVRRERVLPRRISIVEGAYCNHPSFGDVYDLRVFIDVDPDEQKRRIIAREGGDAWPTFESRWIPLERLYHDAFRVREGCGLLL